MRKIRKPDIENTKLSYWEKVLESWGLGLQEEPEKTDNGTMEEIDGEKQPAKRHAESAP